MKEYRPLTSFFNFDNAIELQHLLDDFGIDNVIKVETNYDTQADEHYIYLKCDQKDWLNVFEAVYDKIKALRKKDVEEENAYVKSHAVVSEKEVEEVSIKLNDMIYYIARKYTSFTEEVTVNRTLNNDPQEDDTAYVNFNLNLDYLVSFVDSFTINGNQAISNINLNDPKEVFVNDACITLDDEANDLNNTHVSYDIEEEIYNDGKEFKQICKLIVYDFMKKVNGQIIDGFEVSFKKQNNEAYIVLTKQN